MSNLSTDDTARLNTWTDEIAEALKPEALVDEQSDGSIRIGSKGSLSIGPVAGHWYDFEAEKGGKDALTLIDHVLAANDQSGTLSAGEWAKSWLESNTEEGSLVQSTEASQEKHLKRHTRQIEYASKVIAEATVPDNMPTEIYLRSRGLEPPYPNCVRHMANARTGESAMVGVLTDDAEKTVAIQLTYLTPNGKKSTVTPQRRNFGLVPGGTSLGLFRFPVAMDDGIPERMVLAEGVEDAMSLWKARAGTAVVGIPGISYLGKMPVANSVPLVIFRDGDAAESRASSALRQGVDRLILAGIGPVSVTTTPEELDANDIFQSDGPVRIIELIEKAEIWKLSPDGEILSLSKLSALEYEQCRNEKARALGIRVSALDALVQEDHTAEQPEAHEHLMAKEVEPWSEEVNLADVLNEGIACLRQYVHLDEGSACTVLLWAAHTFVHGLVSVSPRLGIQSPEKGCGKTTLMEAVSLMVPKPVTAASISTASVFRLIDAMKPTLLLDEADQLFRSDNADLLAVLNSSHRKASAYVIRTVEVSPGNFQPTLFSTFAPVVFAGIDELPPTLQDRSLIIRLERALPGEVVKHLEDGFAHDLANVGRKMARWAQDIAELPRCDLSGIPGLYNRAGDNWQPLLGIAERAGGEWPERALAAAKQAVVASMDDQSTLVLLLSDIKDAFGERDKISSADLVGFLLGIEDGPYMDLNHGKSVNQHWLAKQLKGSIQGNSHSIRFGNKTPKGYERDQFKSAWRRYIPSGAPKIAATSETPQQAMEIQDSLTDKSATTPIPQCNTEEGDENDQDEMLQCGGASVAGDVLKNPQETMGCGDVAPVALNSDTEVL